MSPDPLADVLPKLPGPLRAVLKQPFRLRGRCDAVTNVYHCCVHRSGSQWIRFLLADARVADFTGLTVHSYYEEMADGNDLRNLNERSFARAFPKHTIVSPLYIHYAHFESCPKPPSWRAFFVMRDPRDLVVSNYFSMKHSHDAMGSEFLQHMRHELSQCDEEQGLRRILALLHQNGTFESIASWLVAPGKNPWVHLVQYEELTGPDQEMHLSQLLDHCRIRLPRVVFHDLLEDYSFRKVSGREEGQEDVHSHWRKGVAGDWANHFTPALVEHMKSLTGDLITDLGYAW